MHCIVTAGPTYEPLDRVRRLTNFSTGKLGCALADFLASHDHEVLLLLSESASFYPENSGPRVDHFTSSASLKEKLGELTSDRVDVVFHAAAVSDFKFGKVWSRQANGELKEMKAGKLSSREGPLLAELLPAAKIIAELRPLFPTARLVGWKFEIDGKRENALEAARKQVRACLLDGCVANGPGYGEGYGFVVSREGQPERHFDEQEELFAMLMKWM